MKPRQISLILMIIALAMVAGAFWLALQSEVRSDTVCGPMVTQKNARFSACDEFYRSRQTTLAAVAGIGLVSYVASSIVLRRDPAIVGELRRRP